MDIDVSELNALSADFGKASVKAVKAAHEAIAKAAADTVRDSKLFCPVDTGNLRSSITATVRGLSAEVGPTASYGRFVEEGTSRMAPRAYMGPAFDRAVPGLVQALTKAGDL